MELAPVTKRERHPSIDAGCERPKPGQGRPNAQSQVPRPRRWRERSVVFTFANPP